MEHKPFTFEKAALEGVRVITPKVINDTSLGRTLRRIFDHKDNSTSP
jgi:hypothetical protein